VVIHHLCTRFIQRNIIYYSGRIVKFSHEKDSEREREASLLKGNMRGTDFKTNAFKWRIKLLFKEPNPYVGAFDKSFYN
jgi:hypothetical protein